MAFSSKDRNLRDYIYFEDGIYEHTFINLIKRTAAPIYDYDFEGKCLRNVSCITDEDNTNTLDMKNASGNLEIAKNTEIVNKLNWYSENSTEVKDDLVLTEDNSNINVDTTGGNKTITLPPISAVNYGKSFKISNIGTGSVIMNTTGGDLISTALNLKNTISMPRLNSNIILTSTENKQWIVQNHGYPQNDTFYINNQSDLPEPVGNIITLKPGRYIFPKTATFLNKSLSIDGNGNCTLEGGLIYFIAPGLPLFNITNFNNKGLFIFNMSFFDLTGGGVGPGINTFYSISDSSGSPFSGMLLYFSAVGFFNDMGTVKDISYVMENSFIISCSSGLKIQDTIGFGISRCSIELNNIPNTHYMEFNGNNQYVSLANSAFKPKSNECIIYINPAGNIDALVCQSLAVSLINGGAVFCSNSRDQTYITHSFTGNTNIPDSTITALIRLQDNLTATIIPGNNALTLVNGNLNFTGESLERISNTNDGVLTYYGLETAKLIFDSNCNSEPDIGAGKDLYSVISNLEYHTLYTCTFDNITDTVISVGHDFINGEVISFYDSSGILPVGIFKNSLYRVRNKTDDTFQISYTPISPILLFADNGVPPNHFMRCKISQKASLVVSVSKPLDLVNQWLFSAVETGDKFAIYVSSLDGTDILVDNMAIRCVKS